MPTSRLAEGAEGLVVGGAAGAVPVVVGAGPGEAVRAANAVGRGVGEASVAGVRASTTRGARRPGDRGHPGIVLAGPSVGVAVRVVPELREHPGGEDEAESGKTAAESRRPGAAQRRAGVPSPSRAICRTSSLMTATSAVTVCPCAAAIKRCAPATARTSTPRLSPRCALAEVALPPAPSAAPPSTWVGRNTAPPRRGVGALPSTARASGWARSSLTRPAPRG